MPSRAKTAHATFLMGHVLDVMARHTTVRVAALEIPLHGDNHTQMGAGARQFVGRVFNTTTCAVIASAAAALAVVASIFHIRGQGQIVDMKPSIMVESVADLCTQDVSRRASGVGRLIFLVPEGCLIVSQVLKGS